MDALSRKWRGWQVRRQAKMIAGGMAPNVAKEVSTREAVGRQRHGQIIGDEAAMRATVIWRDQPDGTTKFYLVADEVDDFPFSLDVVRLFMFPFPSQGGK